MPAWSCALDAALPQVESFKRCVQKRCDIIVVDQNLDFPGVHILGTTIVEEVKAAGYKGLVCIRSSNNSKADCDLYRRSGAHCHIGKDVRMKDMAFSLVRAYIEITKTSGLASASASETSLCSAFSQAAGPPNTP